MDALAQEFADKAHFLFIYVREAHPDTFPDHPAHASYEQKLRHARDLQQKWGTPRTILVDSLDGDVHRVWGGMPNMSWVVDHAGRVAFKAGWTVAKDLRSVLEETLRARQMKRDGVTTAAYYQERFTYARELSPEVQAQMTYLRDGRDRQRL
jgi:Iodothyronine deiodinase